MQECKPADFCMAGVRPLTSQAHSHGGSSQRLTSGCNALVVPDVQSMLWWRAGRLVSCMGRMGGMGRTDMQRLATLCMHRYGGGSSSSSSAWYQMHGHARSPYATSIRGSHPAHHSAIPKTVCAPSNMHDGQYAPGTYHAFSCVQWRPLLWQQEPELGRLQRAGVPRLLPWDTDGRCQVRSLRVRRCGRGHACSSLVG